MAVFFKFENIHASSNGVDLKLAAIRELIERRRQTKGVKGGVTRWETRVRNDLSEVRFIVIPRFDRGRRE